MQQPLLQVINGSSTTRYPIWFMRQAGRYLPEYMKLREQYSFLQACKTPKIAAEITLQPLRRFDLDAAIIFSDILMIPQLFNQTLSFDKGHGPILSPPFDDAHRILALEQPIYRGELDFVGEAIQIVRHELPKSQSVIGFAGAPFTVMCYMIDGKNQKNFLNTQKILYQQPQAFTKLLEAISQLTFSYLKMQMQAGADVLMLFDSWANILPSHMYERYVYPHTNQLLARLKEAGYSTIYYPGQDASRLFCLKDLQADVVSVDWRVELKQADEILKQQNTHKVLQGNLNPLSTLADQTTLREEVKRILKQAQSLKGHIFNVGHGLTPQTPIQSLQTIIEEIRSWK